MLSLLVVIFLTCLDLTASVTQDATGLYSTLGLQNKLSNDNHIDIKQGCPPACSCNITEDKRLVDCSEKHMKEIPLELDETTNELHASNNRITQLSHNGTFMELSLLNVSNNAINKINGHWLKTLIKLKILDISVNNLHSEGLGDVFVSLPLKFLSLSHNDLRLINTSMFQEMKWLHELDISNNNIHSIENNSFISLLSLQKLDLSFNKLEKISFKWFTNLKQLKTLFLQHNNLQALSNVVFSPLNNLQYLDLSENNINSVGLLTFKGLHSLTFLNISNNNIIGLQEGLFRPLENIKTIDLSYNILENFDNSFLHTASLEILNLKNLRNLVTLSASSLSGLQNVQVIDFSGSETLSYVHKLAFQSTKQLRSLDFSNSNISILHNGVFKGLAKMHSINLSGNPWKCDCYLYWLLIWLGEHTNTNLLLPSETFCNSPTALEGHILLDALDHDMECINASIKKYTKKAQFRIGSTALLQCQAAGSPLPSITWLTPMKHTLQWTGNGNISKVESGSKTYQNHDEIKFMNKRQHMLLMRNGDLLIRNVEKSDGGFYVCTASNPSGNESIAIRLILDYEYLTHVKIVSILVGMAVSFGFLLLTLVSVLIKMILRRCGVKWCFESKRSSPKSQQIKKILESMEHYKKQQLEKLRENYNSQVQKIKDNCMQQMERLRESYSSQAERLRDIRDYGTLQIDRIRENYYLQVQRVRDYSTNQIERLRENYIFQRDRIRKFSAHHLYKFRENYKLQQQHLNKILENLNIESCRNVCQRTDSMVFEPDINLENVFVPKICLSEAFSPNQDSVDNSSQISAYFTPDEASSELSDHETTTKELKLHNIGKSISYTQLPTVGETNDSPRILTQGTSTNTAPNIATLHVSKFDKTNETIV